MGARRSSTWDRRRRTCSTSGRSTASRSDSGTGAPSSRIVGVGGARACLLARGSKCAFFLLPMYPTSGLNERQSSVSSRPRAGWLGRRGAAVFVKRAGAIPLEGRTHLPSVWRTRLASLGDDSIVDLLIAVTPIRARTTTLWHDNSSSEPHRSRATQAIRRRSANSSAQQRPPQQPNVATTALPLLRTTVAPAR